MLKAPIFVKSSLEAIKKGRRPLIKTRHRDTDFGAHLALVPIRSLGENQRPRIEQHLLSLDAHDRYLRFGYGISDDQLHRYVASLDFLRDEIFGIFNRKLELIAVAHLAHAKEGRRGAGAEFGVSVLPQARGRGYGARLFERASIHATNDGVSVLFIHALSENTAMLKIARNAGARVERDGIESDAYLRLPPASMESHLSELVHEQIAQMDYRLKVQAKALWSFLANMQEIRRDAIAANQRSSP